MVDPLLQCTTKMHLHLRSESYYTVEHIMRNDAFLSAITSSENLYWLFMASETFSSKDYPTLFTIYTYLLERGIDIVRKHIYTGLRDAEILNKVYDRQSAFLFVYSDLENGVDEFEFTPFPGASLLDKAIEFLNSGHSEARSWSANIILKLIRISLFNKAQELAKSHLQLIFTCIPHMSHGQLKLALDDLTLVLRRNVFFVNLAFEYEIDSNVFENIETEFEDCSEIIDSLYNFLHPM